MNIKLNLEFHLILSYELNSLLEELAKDSSKEKVLRDGIILIKIAKDAKKNGKFFGIASKLESLETEIIGF